MVQGVLFLLEMGFVEAQGRGALTWVGIDEQNSSAVKSMAVGLLAVIRYIGSVGSTGLGSLDAKVY